MRNRNASRLRVIVHPSSFILLAATLLVAACGFQLRGTATLPFDSIYVQAAPASQLATQLRQAVLAGSSTRIAERPEEAVVILQILSELQEKQILSLTGGGRVSEFQLRLRVAFRLTDSKNRAAIPGSGNRRRRACRYRAMLPRAPRPEDGWRCRKRREDAVSQLVRRLQAAKIKS